FRSHTCVFSQRARAHRHLHSFPTRRSSDLAGVTAPIITFRDAENVSHLLTADQVIALVDAGKERVQAIYSASWAIKSMDPLPTDVAADELWPLPTGQA